MSSEPAFTEAWSSLPSDSFQLFTRTWAASDPRAVVVFIHGFAEHVSRNGYNIAFTSFASKGISVFAFDQRGFGKTAAESEKRGDGSYARTNGSLARSDIDWAVNHVKNEHPNLPIFLLGHSMGGALSLSTCTQSPALPVVSKITGVIATSPLIQQTVPASKIARFVGGKAAILTPNLPIPAPLNAEALSHDPAENEAYVKDPLIKLQGTLRQLSDMLNNGDELHKAGHRHWPAELPVLIIHGSEDQITSHAASRDFCEKIKANDKKYSLYEGGYHELWNEPNGVKEKLAEECVEWILAHSGGPVVARL